MKRTIKSPAPQLSELKEFNIDLDMTGRHYAQLATSEGQIPEDVALSIIKDLLEEDASKLTIAELRYLFILVKINSLENNYNVTIGCTHEVNGKECGCLNHVKVHLSDGDLNICPKNYKIPEIEFILDEKGTFKKYSVLPPTMAMESALLNWFMNVKNVTLDAIADDKKTSMEYTFIRSLMHLKEKDGNRLINEINDFEPALKYLDFNKYQTVSKLYDYCNEVDKFGVQNKVYEIKCKECGGLLVYRLPLLHGLVD